MNIDKELAELLSMVIISLKQKIIKGEASSSDLANAIKLLKDNGVSQILKPTEDLIELETITVPFKQLEKTNFFADEDTDEVCSIEELEKIEQGLTDDK